MKYKSVVATGRGSTDMLKIVENDRRAPGAGEVRIKILAVDVCQDDIATRVGNRPFLPKVPFVPGYNIVGDVDAIGDGVTGLDAVFNGMAEDYLKRGMAVLRRGGTFVHYGGPESLARFVAFLVQFIWLSLVPDGKAILGYGTHRVDLRLLKEDWITLFALLAEGKIKPIIAAKCPILEAAKANDLLAGGSVVGNIVLLAPELM